MRGAILRSWRVLVLIQVLFLSVTEHKRKLFIVKGKMYCLEQPLTIKEKFEEIKNLTPFRLFRLCRKTNKKLN